MTTMREYGKLFASPSYQKMLADHRRELEAGDKRRVETIWMPLAREIEASSARRKAEIRTAQAGNKASAPNPGLKRYSLS